MVSQTNNCGTRLEEMRLAMVSDPDSDFLSERHKNKVPHLFNRNFGEISKNAPRKLSSWV